MTTPVASFKKSESLAKPRAATFPAFQQAITIKRMRESWGGEGDETRPVSRRQKWLQFGTGRFHAQWAIVIEAAVKRSLASTTRGWNQFLSLPSWYEAAGDGGRGDSSRGSLKDAFYGGTRRARNRKCVLHLSSPGGRFIVHHRLERWMDACIHEPSASLRAFHSGGERGGGRLVSLSRPWNFHSPRSLPRTNHSPSECEQRFAQFIIDLHADSSYIIRPRFLGLERSQRHQENEDGCCWDGVLYGGVFNRNSILSCDIIGAFCRIL